MSLHRAGCAYINDVAQESQCAEKVTLAGRVAPHKESQGLQSHVAGGKALVATDTDALQECRLSPRIRLQGLRLHGGNCHEPLPSFRSYQTLVLALVRGRRFSSKERAGRILVRPGGCLFILLAFSCNPFATSSA